MSRRTVSLLLSLVLVGLAIASLTALVAGQDEDVLHFLPIIEKPVPTLTPSSTPTNTPIPSPTMPPTSTPTPTATPEPGVRILPNYSSLLDSDGELWIFGEVSNTTNQYAGYVRVTVNILNNAGNVVDAISTYTFLDVAPGDKSCFLFYDYPPPPDYTVFEFAEVSYYPVSDQYPNLTVTDHIASLSGDFYVVQGHFRNDDSVRVRNLEIVGTFYNSPGTVVGCVKSYEIDADYLDPGQSTAFQAPWWHNIDSIRSYRLQPSGTLP